MEDLSPVTRSDLRRALVVNAATKPSNVGVAAAVVVAAVLLDVRWLLAVAVACYAALALVTFLDEGEAERVGRRLYERRRAVAPHDDDLPDLAPPVAQRVDAALDAADAVHAAIAEADVPLPDVAAEVDGLVTAMRRVAVRASRVYEYFATREPAALARRVEALRATVPSDPGRARLLGALESQLEAIDRLQGQLQRFYDDLDHVIASLEAVHAEVVALGAVGAAPAEAQLAGQVGDLREQVSAAAAGIDAAYAETRAGARVIDRHAGDE